MSSPNTTPPLLKGMLIGFTIVSTVIATSALASIAKELGHLSSAHYIMAHALQDLAKSQVELPRDGTK